jgi:hypothetical protein
LLAPASYLQEVQHSVLGLDAAFGTLGTSLYSIPIYQIPSRLCTAKTAADTIKQKQPACMGVWQGTWVLWLPGFPDACTYSGCFVFICLFLFFRFVK